MDPKDAMKTAMRDAEDESTDNLAVAAGMIDMVKGGPHRHAWWPRPGRDRLVGDVWQYPYECACGATAWKQNWCGEVQYVDVQEPPPAVLLQNDTWRTPLPNGMLRWFGFDFDRAEMPDEPLLPGGRKTQWVGANGRFFHQTSISDAWVTIEVAQFKTNGQPMGEFTRSVVPREFRVSVQIKGEESPEISCYEDWTDVQQHCRSAEQKLHLSAGEETPHGESRPTAPTGER